MNKAHWKTLSHVRLNSSNGVDTVVGLADFATLESHGYIKFHHVGFKVTPAGRAALKAYEKDTR